MTANLVVQVCLEPKLVGVALERDSVTAAARGRGRCLHDLVACTRRPRRGAPLREARDRGGACSGRGGPRAVGPPGDRGRTGRLPVLAAAAGYLVCTRDGAPSSWGATRSASARSTRSGASPARSSAWRTPACTTAAERAVTVGSGRCGSRGRRSMRRVRIAVDQLRLGVADHGVVGEVPLGLLAEALPLGTLDGWHAPGPDRLGPLAEPDHHLLWVEPGHGGQRRGY